MKDDFARVGGDDTGWVELRGHRIREVGGKQVGQADHAADNVRVGAGGQVQCIADPIIGKQADRSRAVIDEGQSIGQRNLDIRCERVAFGQHEADPVANNFADGDGLCLVGRDWCRRIREAADMANVATGNDE